MLWWTLRQLNSINDAVRTRAIDKLAQSKDPGVVPALIQVLKRRENLDVQCAAEALIRIGGAGVQEALLVTIKDEKPMTRIKAAGVLGRIGDAAAVELAVKTLAVEIKSKRDYEARHAVDKLAEMGRSEAMEPLVTGLANVHSYVQGVALRGLNRTDPNWRKSQAAKRAVPTLVAELQSPDQKVRSLAAYALWKIRDASATEALLAALEDTGTETRMFAAAALGEIGDARAVEHLVGLLPDNSEEVRLYATSALDKIDVNWRDSDAARRAVPTLVLALNAGNPGKRNAAAKTLAEISCAAETLNGMLSDSDPAVRVAVVDALEGIDAPSVVKPLVACLEDPDVQVRSKAGRLLRPPGKWAAHTGAVAALDKCHKSHGKYWLMTYEDLLDVLTQMRTKEEIVEIGEELNRRGGEDLMLSAHKSVIPKLYQRAYFLAKSEAMMTSSSHRHSGTAHSVEEVANAEAAENARFIERMWDGIGGWRG